MPWHLWPRRLEKTQGIYSVEGGDSVIELTDVPQMDTGAPMPLVVGDDHRLIVSYWCVDDSPDHPDTQPMALISFELPRLHILGSPNDEALHGHPLYARGLGAYGAFEVRSSSLVRSLERMNRVHHRHDPERFNLLKHYILSFHDSTFECVAKGYTASVEWVGMEKHTRTFEAYDG